MLELFPIDLPLNVDEQRVKHCEPNTQAYQRNAQLGEGTLYISEDKFIWSSTEGRGFILAYPQISLHAISRDLTNFHSECLYLMFDEGGPSGNDDQDSDDESSEINELRFVPRDLSKLDAMYRALCECQLLHPDPQDSVSEDEVDEEEEGEEGDHDQPASDHHNGGDDGQMEVGDAQFEDAQHN